MTSAPAIFSSCGRRPAARPSCCRSTRPACRASTLQAGVSSWRCRRRRRESAETRPSFCWSMICPKPVSIFRDHAQVRRIDHHVAREHSHHLPRHVSGAARFQPRRQSAGGRPVDARCRRHPRACDRPAPFGRRHAGRRRSRHGDAGRRAGPRHRCAGARGRSAPAPGDEPARRSADPGAGRGAGRRGPARSFSAAASRASTSA